MTLANRITLFRVAMIPFFIATIYLYGPDRTWLRGVALGIYAMAAISDFLDGYIARKFDQRSLFGTRLDPLADKLIINLGLVFMAANPEFVPMVPKWFPIVILGRDVAIALGALLMHERYDEIKFNPRLLGKLTTSLQMATLIAALVKFPWTAQLIYITLAITVLSFFDYYYAGVQQVLRHKAENAEHSQPQA